MDFWIRLFEDYESEMKTEKEQEERPDRVYIVVLISNPNPLYNQGTTYGHLVTVHMLYAE